MGVSSGDGRFGRSTALLMVLPFWSRCAAKTAIHADRAELNQSGHNGQMAYDEALAERLLMQVSDDADIKARKMFGGYAIMWRGNMLAGVIGDDLMVRVGPEAHEELLAETGAQEMLFTGRPMKGMLTVANESLGEDESLATWVQRCKDFVGSLPPK